MKRLLLSAVPIVGLALLLALPECSLAGAMRSAASCSTARSSTPVIIVASPFAVASVPGNAEEDYAYGAEETVSLSAVIRVRVPVNAEVWFDGNKTSQSGSLRPFVTADLKPGLDYAYEIRARWTEEGRQIELTRKVMFRSGDLLTLNLTAPR